MSVSWKDRIQLNLVKDLLDELNRLEDENEKLRQNKNGTENCSSGNSDRASEAEDVRRIKLRIFGEDEER